MKSALGVALVVAWFTLMVLAYAEPRPVAATSEAAQTAQPTLTLADEAGRWQVDVDLALAIGFASQPRPTEVGLVLDGNGSIAIQHAGKNAVVIQPR